MYRLMCFNVYAHNRDDHSKNFTFLYDDDKGVWKLSPAYDLTYSNSLGGEHATSVNGNGRDPSGRYLAVADTSALQRQKQSRSAAQVEDTVAAELGDVGQYRT